MLDSNFEENNNEFLIGLATYQTNRQMSGEFAFFLGDLVKLAITAIQSNSGKFIG